MNNYIQKIIQDVSIGANIRKIRNRQKLTQDMVVARLQLRGINITRNTYAKIESNCRGIYASEIIALKNIFRVEYNEFFEGLEIGEEE